MTAVIVSARVALTLPRHEEANVSCSDSMRSEIYVRLRRKKNDLINTAPFTNY